MLSGKVIFIDNFKKFKNGKEKNGFVCKSGPGFLQGIPWVKKF